MGFFKKKKSSELKDVLYVRINKGILDKFKVFCVNSDLSLSDAVKNMMKDVLGVK